MINMRGFADCSFTTLAKNFAPSSAAVHAPRDLRRRTPSRHDSREARRLSGSRVDGVAACQAPLPRDAASSTAWRATPSPQRHRRDDGPDAVRPTRSEPAQIRKRDHPRPRLVQASRVDGVRAPESQRTPRYALLDGHDVIIYRLGHADDGDGVVVALEVFRDLRRLRVRVIPADRVEDGHLVHHQLLGRSVERVFSLNYESTLHAVFHIGQFDSGVADGRAAVQL